ncbi:hypothetical protein PLICRDRAFT_39766 [Plicaturopsis crispa FD-325 SS-3]|nr:hypothetical protein PLICRDRAFT_39766 [Plicaturopsis crispa FD-325 SS-3]
MSLLFKHLRVHQIFGANTDVGKTILTSALVRASAANHHPVFYLKPVSTGPPEEADDGHVNRYAGAHLNNNRVRTECLYRFTEPVSPHLAATLEPGLNTSEVVVPSDETFATSVASHIRRCAAQCEKYGHMYVETAGGVHSPTLSGTTQADSYRPLFLPTILIGDSRLGGISSTISSYESLMLRGYMVDAILIFRDEYYRNWEYLKPYFGDRNVTVMTVDPPPERISNAAENFIATENYYNQIVPKNKEGAMFDVLRILDDTHRGRLEELDSMPRRTLDTVWWPFVQHGLVKGEEDVTVIDSAYSDFFSVYNPRRGASQSRLEPQFDGSASWWTQAIGHAHPSLAVAAARAAGRYGHVMFPQATHEPALRLAEHLVHEGPGKGWAARAFISDNGATGMEIALKMALRAFSAREGDNLDAEAKSNLGVIGLKGSYHGDTIGAMDACEEGVYTCEWHNAKGYWFDPPTISFQNGKVVITLPGSISGKEVETTVDAESLTWAYDVPDRLTTPLAHTYREYISRTLRNLQENGGPKFAALVLEPLLMGAGGMIFVDPLFQRVMIDVVRGAAGPTTGSEWRGVPVIFDEVFVGLYRIGMQSTGPLLGVNPDILVNAKILTGGLLPLAVTLATDSIFQAFLSENKTDALLHGHSYTAHAVGCEVANETLNIIERLPSSQSWQTAQSAWAPETPKSDRPDHVWSFWDPGFVKTVSSMEIVSDVMTLGTVLAVELKDTSAGYSSKTAQAVLQSIKTTVDGDSVVSSAPGGAPFGIHFRTLGNVAYFMTSLNTPAVTIRSIEDKIWAALRRSSPSGAQS